jgi:hypothetical protein
MAGRHRCPIDGCATPVPVTQLMCREHWSLVPPDEARELYAAYDRGRGWGSERHLEAMDAAIEAVRQALEERGAQ